MFVPDSQPCRPPIQLSHHDKDLEEGREVQHQGFGGVVVVVVCCWFCFLVIDFTEVRCFGYKYLLVPIDIFSDYRRCFQLRGKLSYW